ncbi:MAG: hypothetical protein WAK23_17765 [Terriglobales bacterium]
MATANFRVSGFRPEISIVADVLAAAIVDDVELQRGIIEVLKDRDEQSRLALIFHGRGDEIRICDIDALT